MNKRTSVKEQQAANAKHHAPNSTAGNSRNSKPANNKTSIKQESALAKIKTAWGNFCLKGAWAARILVALFVCALLWLMLWYMLFSGISGSADFIYSKF